MNESHSRPPPFFSTRDLLFASSAFLVSLFLLIPEPLGIRRHVFAITWSSIFLEAFCFMLIGSVISGFIEEFVPRSFIERLMFGNQIAVVTSSASMGLIFPVCECAIVLVVRRLLKKGLPLTAGIAFMLAAPIINPVVIWSTSVAYQGQYLVIISRTLFGYCIACLAAVLMGTIFNTKQAILSGISDVSHSNDWEHCHNKYEGYNQENCRYAQPNHRTPWYRIISCLHHACDDLFDIAPYLVIGTFVAALIRSLIPASYIQQLAEQPILSIGGMMALAFSLNLCSEADAFIAASFAGIVNLAGQMAFMVLGPMLDIKLLLMYRSVFRKKFIILLAGVVVSLVFLLMLFFLYFVEGVTS
jgi:uncharacterized membrane protein YraQ (UPF0718 family)